MSSRTVSMILGNQFQWCSTANLRRERDFGRKNSSSVVHEKNSGLYLKVMGQYIAKTPAGQVPWVLAGSGPLVERDLIACMNRNELLLYKWWNDRLLCQGLEIICVCKYLFSDLRPDFVKCAMFLILPENQRNETFVFLWWELKLPPPLEFVLLSVRY